MASDPGIVDYLRYLPGAFIRLNLQLSLLAHFFTTRRLQRFFSPQCEFAYNSTRYRSEEHTSELQSPYVISYAVFCLKQTKTHHHPRLARLGRRSGVGWMCLRRR